MDLNKTLNAVGKAVFVKYYYIFMNMKSEDCLEMFTENYTDKSKKNRVYSAKMIFRERKELKALKIICASKRVDSKTKDRAMEIFSKEIIKRRYCFFD